MIWKLLIISILSLGTSSYLVGFTRNEMEQRKHIPLTLAEYLPAKRNFFLGHKECSDLIDAMNVVASTFDVIRHAGNPAARQSIIQKRFENSAQQIGFLSRFSLGMSELYLLPAMHYFFDEERPDLAMPIVDLGIADKRTDLRIPLLGGFIAHAFLQDAPSAGKYYAIVASRPGVPQWVSLLSKKLLSGNDPYELDPSLREKINKTIENTFPHARAYLKRQTLKSSAGEKK